MSFCTAISCIDGRVQEPVQHYLRKRFGVEYIDTITEPGPAKLLSEGTNLGTIASVMSQLNISVGVHESVGIALACHHDCAGNSAPDEFKLQQMPIAIDFLRSKYPQLPIIGLFVDANWQVQEVVPA